MARMHRKKSRTAGAAEAAKKAAREELSRIHSSPCPSCGARDATAVILYGLPIFDDELTQDLDRGLMVLGGCDMVDGQPDRCCARCKHEWRAMPDTTTEPAR